MPYPLSLLDPHQPILQTTVLSSYFDNPCASNCSAQTIPKTLARNWIHSKPAGFDLFAVPALNLSSTPQQSLGNQNNNSSLNITAEVLSRFNHSISSSDSLQVNCTHDCPSLSAVGYVETQPEDAQDSKKSFPMLSPWQIFRFFLTRQASNNSTHFSLSLNNQSLVDSNEPAVRTDAFLNSSGKLKIALDIKPTETGKNQSIELIPQQSEQIRCDQLDKRICIEFSTDRLLRGRLCCLNEGISSIGSGLGGCKRFNKTKCNEMLPQIKCCLKDFASLLKDYFQTHQNNS